MQAIRQTQQLNKRELENATPPSASWHADYRDTAWVYVGGLPFDLTEGDVVIIFSQFGNPTHLNLVRDKDTGKSKGFGFLKYEDQRSCDLAVDNLTGAEVLGKLLRVDHTRYKKRDDEDDDTYRIDRLEAEAAAEKNGKRASDTEESDDERRRRKRHRARLEDTKKLAIKEYGEATGSTRGHGDEDTNEARARRGQRERKHEHRHRHRDHEEDEDKHFKRDGVESARRDRNAVDRKTRGYKHSLSRERSSRNASDDEDSDPRKKLQKASSHARDERDSHHRSKHPTRRDPERRSRRLSDSDEEGNKYSSSRNGKTKRSERIRE